MTETDVAHVAAFMGHDDPIHRRIYRQPTVSVDILKMSSVLQQIQTPRTSQQNRNGSSETTKDAIVCQGNSHERRLDNSNEDDFDSEPPEPKKQLKPNMNNYLTSRANHTSRDSWSPDSNKDDSESEPST
ncbi:uncharacterized protein LOC117174082 [Belonocnema kinseyi]|uniref:uncharacterized protein LOC117174082 n=1 Tax=Belonocnema kinseyi TaxID=2817044 RepID=UPI00143D3C4E|nr:uncharacterized protein LOC117174082 [Belonocnema kinseyi]